MIILLLNISVIETVEKLDAYLEKELKVNGIANIIGGLFGSFPCNLSLSGSILNKNTGGTYCLSGITASCTCLLIFLVYPHIFTLIPIPVIGGLLFYLALKLMIEWLYYGWFKLTHTDYLIVVIIGLSIAVWNFLPGTFIGIIITCVVFVVHYAKTETIKVATSGKYYHSSVNRALHEQKWLVENGYKVRIFRLQGYLFFGSTKLLLDNIRNLIQRKANRVQYLIFDFQLVNDFDSSATLSWVRLYQLTNSYHLYLIFTHCSPYFIQQMNQQITANDKSIILFFSDIDKAMEWCEEEILKSLSEDKKPKKSNVVHILTQLMYDINDQALFTKNLEKFELGPGDYLFKQGSESNSLDFIETGDVSIYLETYNNRIRLSKSGSGTIVGEIGFYLNTPRTASVIANTNCIIYKLSRETMERLGKTHPDLVLVFERLIINILATRLMKANYLLQVIGIS